jgi:DNA-binding IclR family transcriptional regulator
MFGLKLFSLANMAMNGIKLREQASPALQALAHQSGLTVHMSILDHGEALIIEKIEPPGVRPQASWIGKRFDLHASASGKALLAHLSEDELIRLVGPPGPFPRHNDNTITSIRRLQQDLAEIKRRGYSIESEEDEIGIRCIGAPVFGETGEVIAAVSVSGTTEQIKAECISHPATLVKETASQIGATIS